MMLEISHSRIVHVCIQRLYILLQFCSNFHSDNTARTKHLSVLHGFCSGLDRSNPFGGGFVAPRCFQFDGGETLFLAEVLINVTGDTRFVEFVAVFKVMVASYLLIVLFVFFGSLCFLARVLSFVLRFNLFFI